MPGPDASEAPGIASDGRGDAVPVEAGAPSGRGPACASDAGGRPDRPESCNAVDDDCDGAIDEGCDCTADAQRGCGTDVGACELGTQRCIDGRWGLCEGAVSDRAEQCDGGLDEDCDGAVDEGCGCGDGEARPCGRTMGACEQGAQRCAGGIWGVCEGAVEPAAEQCDGVLDEDCDGAVDEGCACVDRDTRSCGDTDLGACAFGTQTCELGSFGPCIGALVAGTEVCDGSVDEDCDGAVDEGCACVNDDSRPCGSDVGSCELGSQTCVGGAWGACEGDVGPGTEVCDGVEDENCDGAVDEGCICVNDDSRPCGSDVGNCELGTQTCAEGVWGMCQGDVGPEDETCDGSDENCDGQADDGFGVGSACDGDDDDECPDGQVVCDVDGTARCNDDAGSVSEQCNGIDDDCDGPIDEDFGVCTACCDSLDVDDCDDDDVVCTGPSSAACTDVGGVLVEFCNDIDDNCDGTVDEGYGLCEGCCDADTDLDTCSDDAIECTSPSTSACVDRGADADGDGYSVGDAACDGDCNDANPGIRPGADELCDAIDNDCDGAPDEGFGLCQDCCDSGDDADLCDDDAVQCTGVLTSACVDSGSALTEVCDTLDNDCDGRVDEGFGTCVGCCDSGDDTDLCSDDDVVCTGPGTTACVDAGGSIAELCDGADNDCNAATEDGADETWFGMPCDGADLGLCEEGVYECVSSSQECSDQTGDDPDLCDGEDNDCDATTADGAHEPWLGMACDGGDADDCPDGVEQCMDGNPICTDDAASGVETCNGLDDDCDGTTDEESGFSALPIGLVVLFDSACPGSGWAELSDSQDRFVVGHDGDASFGEIGGSDTHDHNMSHAHTSAVAASPSHGHSMSTIFSISSGVQNVFTLGANEMMGGHGHTVSSGGTSATGGGHDHTLSAGNLSGAPTEALPPYREVALCVNQSSSRYSLPTDSMTLAESVCGAGSTVASEFQGRLIRGHDGDATFGETGGGVLHTHDATHNHGGGVGGDDNHTHPAGGTTGTTQGSYPSSPCCGSSQVGDHYHTLRPSGPGAHGHPVISQAPALSDANAVPPHVEIRVCRASLDVCPPPGTVALFDAACPGGWTELTQYRQQYLRGDDGDANAQESGGNAFHVHSGGSHSHPLALDAGHTHPVATMGPTPLATWRSFGGTASRLVRTDHTHGGSMSREGGHTHGAGTATTFGTGTAPNEPPWRELVVCVLN